MAGKWPEIRAAKDGVFYVPDATHFTVAGTIARWWMGYPADLARWLESADDGRYVWQPVEYPAETFPMWPSILQGIFNLEAEINRHPGKIVLDGYSQGAIVVSVIWRDYILSPTGPLHHRLDDVVAVITYGNPMRCPGKANGNLIAGKPLPSEVSGYVTGGIAGPNCLKPDQVPDFFLDFANNGDLYACSPVGETPWDEETEVGENQTLIYNMIMEITGADFIDMAKKLMEIVAQPLSQLLPLVQAIGNGVLFFGQGPRSGHYTYDVAPAAHYLLSRPRT